MRNLFCSVSGLLVTMASGVERAVLLAAIMAPLLVPFQTLAAVQPGFQESTVFSGLTNPTALRFSPDGRIFIAEKSGLIKVFDSLTDPSPTVFADLRTKVHNFWDRGLLGLALHPNFPATPFVYVLYTYDHVLGDSAPPPRWGTAGATSDPCPDPPGATGDGCVVSGRLSRLQASGSVMTGSEMVLVEDWCQQYPSHSIGTLAFGADGALYVSAGDGASFNFTDYGQEGSPPNPCGDPVPVGGSQTPPGAQGGRCVARIFAPTVTPSRWTAPLSALIRRPGRRCRITRLSVTAIRMPGGLSLTVCAIPSGSSSAPAQMNSGSETWDGTSGRRSTASSIHPT